MVLFTHNAKQIKDAALKNGNIDGTCKRALKDYLYEIHCVIYLPSFNVWYFYLDIVYYVYNVENRALFKVLNVVFLFLNYP